MKKLTKIVALLLALVLSLGVLTACGGEEIADPNAKTATYDEMVTWLTAKGYIAEGATPVDINTTAGYVTDNTGGSFPFATLADKACDYDGLWLFWWDLENPTDTYGCYESMSMNSGTIVFAGGACVITTSAQNGAYAIAFAEDYAQKDAVLTAFKALSAE